MATIYRHTEKSFEKLTSVAITILGNSVTFIASLLLVIFWLGNKQFFLQPARDAVRDVILAVAFLSLFIIQKSFNRFSAAMHLKVNELVASHGAASNAVINLEEKTEQEINQLANEYSELTAEIKEEIK